MNDPINPANYRRFPVEVIQLAECLTFNPGNVVKYTARAGTKPGEPIERDLAKAGWYIDRELARLGFVTETARLRTELEEAQQQLRETHADHEAERARLETHQL